MSSRLCVQPFKRMKGKLQVLRRLCDTSYSLGQESCSSMIGIEHVNPNMEGVLYLCQMGCAILPAGCYLIQYDYSCIHLHLLADRGSACIFER